MSQTIRRTSVDHYTYLLGLVPKAVRIKRAKGVVVQGCDVYVSKECRASGWNLNKSKWYKDGTANDTEKYQLFLNSSEQLGSEVYELVGQSLGCWCDGAKTKTCHATVLIQRTKAYISEYIKRHRMRDRDLKTIGYEVDGVKIGYDPAIRYNIKVRHRVRTAYTQYVLKFSESASKKRKVKEPSNSLYMKYMERQDTLKAQSQQPQFVPDKYIIWDNNNSRWYSTDGTTVPTYPNKIAGNAVVTTDKITYHLDSGSVLHDDGRIDVCSIMTRPVITEPEIAADPFSFRSFNDVYLQVDKFPPIAVGRITTLLSEGSKRWDPFVCRVVARLKKGDRYMLQLGDDKGMFKITIGSQIFDLVKEKIVDKGDIIQVVDYAVSNSSNNPQKKKMTLIVHTLRKYVQRPKAKAK